MEQFLPSNRGFMISETDAFQAMAFRIGAHMHFIGKIYIYAALWLCC